MKQPTYAELMDAFIQAYTTLEGLRARNKTTLEFIEQLQAIQTKSTQWDAQRERMLAEAVELVRKLHTNESEEWLENNGYGTTKTVA